MFTQLLGPTPNIPCQPGWCLMYVRLTFGIGTPAYDTATEAWEGARAKHRDMDFPAGVAVPLWFAMKGEPRGHVVLRMPDGSVYSTTDLAPAGYRPRRHPSLADLMAVYAAAGAPLTYLGWTEDIENVPVVAQLAKEDDMNPHELLINPAYTNGPQVSEVLMKLDAFLEAAKDMPKEIHALHEAVFNNDGTNESILGGFSISGLDNHNAVKLLEQGEAILKAVGTLKAAG